LRSFTPEIHREICHAKEGGSAEKGGTHTMHKNSMLLFEKFVKPVLNHGMRVLEIGPDGFPSTYQRLSVARSLEWHTLDMHDSPNLTYPNSGEYRFPVLDGTYDMAISGQVIEHVRKPWKWLPELARVTKFGGLVITIGPVSWTYHEAPVDCWRIYPEGMKALYEEAGLTVLVSHWESLEAPGYKRYIQGISYESQNRKKQIMYKVFGALGLPVERAYDTITIGRKDTRLARAS
jgi:SAM-dependent methyltransferase